MKLSDLLARVRVLHGEVNVALDALNGLDECAWYELEGNVVANLLKAQASLSEAERQLAYLVEVKPQVEAVKARA